ncbi:AhpC/TSA family protein [Echinicola sp. CAU 1574]|uniref:AhpC/TSA family protein n=1 Tax=Echinicola arenosa TaxID=2774144 RepID=A0ABR9AQ00_9BACT|nr:TlpA disulfide reductase family protein [Echinicola arenosa]MBD8490852.1 AhpC/TSA family protein [Echinicola arenosa]
MISIKYLSSLYLCFFLFSATSMAQPFTCTLKGKVINRDSKAIYIIKETEDVRSVNTTVPILEDGSFEYHFEVNQIEAYQLIFKDEMEKGSWRPVTFFPDQELITFELNPSEEFDKNKIEGGKINQAYVALQNQLTDKFQTPFEKISAERRALMENNNFNNDAHRQLISQLKSASPEERNSIYAQLRELSKNHQDKTSEGKKLAIRTDSLNLAYWASKREYIKQNNNELAYFLLYEEVRGIDQFDFDVVSIRKNYIKLAQEFPKHPYTKTVGQIIESHDAVKVGEKAIEIKVPDLKGNLVSLNQSTQGKIVLLDLWASWCGPCIVKSRTMVPIYEKYKDKGFTIFGVAREFDNTNKLEIALAREKFPWKNFVELDDKNDIWLKYNIPFSGGGTFLIDQKGTIVAIDPSAEEVENFIQQHL